MWPAQEIFMHRHQIPSTRISQAFFRTNWCYFSKNHNFISCPFRFSMLSINLWMWVCFLPHSTTFWTVCCNILPEGALFVDLRASDMLSLTYQTFNCLLHSLKQYINGCVQHSEYLVLEFCQFHYVFISSISVIENTTPYTSTLSKRSRNTKGKLIYTFHNSHEFGHFF